MITKEEFLMEFAERGNQYSNFLILNTSVDEVIRVLNQIDPDMCAGDGYVDGNHVGFIIFDYYPELVYDITKELHTTGYADEGWELYEICCARCGKDYDGYSACWTDGPYLHDSDDDEDDEYATWDAFFDIVDNETGIVFHTGAGAVDKDTMLYYKNIVDNHST